MTSVNLASLPESVRVGAVNYAVEFVDNLRKDNDLYGQCIYAETRIRIAADTTAERQIQTFFHELTHAIANEAGEHEINENEAFIERFSNILTQVAIDNDWLTKGILKAKEEPENDRTKTTD